MNENIINVPRHWLIPIALAQGLLLLALHQLLEHNIWLDDLPQWTYSLYSMVVIGPTLTMLSITRTNVAVLLRWLLPFTLPCGLLSFYIGWQALPADIVRTDTLMATWIITLALASFKALMYIQQRASGEKLTYHLLFTLSWRNFLVWGLALAFTLAVWAILFLWGELFKIINIRLFADVFKETWFIYPALGLAHGFGIIIFRAQSNIIDILARIQQALMKFLLVFLVFISILFLITLPFAGLTPLWDTGHGSLMLLWMQGLILFFLNAVYQDDPDNRPYPLWLHRFIYVGVGLLPIYSAIVLYGLSLRIDQYGWTLNRCWALVVWAFFTAFSCGYLWGIVRQRDQWLHGLSWVNVRMGLGLLGVMLLVNSPLLDFRKWVTKDQLARLEVDDKSEMVSGLYYFHYQLARPGYLALQQLKTDAGEGSDIALQIDSLYYRFMPEENRPSSETVVDELIVFPEQPVPQSLRPHLVTLFNVQDWRKRTNDRRYLLTVDMNTDGQDDYVLITFNGVSASATLFHLYNGEWQQAQIYNHGDLKPSDLAAAINAGEVSTQIPPWRQLKIGDSVLQVDNWYSIEAIENTVIEQQ